ncbi:MAG: hypothetical protein CME64_12440 [Halobacteriovoraceae bacterium]|nr:hypothetical protein [Halobacteriovoraceae bacterium]|tara:strand:+ start:204863 stop:206464 length:1602 start_codon:yes stop_codon:yes gene_type:complete
MNKTAHIHLFGDPEENFYALGVKDKDSYQDIYEQITRLCARADFLAHALKMSTELAVNLKSRGSINLSKEIKAYAEGLERPVNDVYFTMLLPEIVASFNKWLPNLMSVIPGCSSLFAYDHKNDGVIHGRILDYALSGPFEKHERSALYDFKGRLKTFSYCSTGLPFPGVTAMNERGLTLALHYKHGNYLDLKGDSIFSIAYQIVSYCADIHEVKKFLKNYPSMSHWGLYLSDRNGDVASIDVRGREVYQEKFNLKEYPYLYFNNRPLLKDPSLKESQPFGALSQCKMRRDSVVEKLKKCDLQNLDDLQVLKLLGSPSSKKTSKGSKWKMDSITPSSIQCVTFNNATLESLFIPGAGPKFFKGERVKYSQIFKALKQKELSSKVKLDEKYIESYERLAKFQSELDAGRVESAYHNIQMAIALLDGKSEKSIVQFYFLIMQYLYEGTNKEFAYLHTDFESLEGKLPPYLEDHRKLFLMRLERILGHTILHSPSDIKNENLKKLFDKEMKLRPQALRFLRKFIFPRIEMLDVIYAY